jgi:hypothetical protein
MRYSDDEGEDDYERSRKKRSSHHDRKDRRRARSRSPRTRYKDSSDDDFDRIAKDKKRSHRDKDVDRVHERRDRKRDRSASPLSSASSSSSALDRDDGSADVRRRRKESDRKSRRKDEKRKKKSGHKKGKRERDKKKKKRKRHEKSSSRKHKRSRSSSGSDSGDNAGSQSNDENKISEELARNYDLAEALYQLLTEHSTTMATDTLPLLLIQLGSGKSFDLRQMTDVGAARGLQWVLSTLQPFGVTQEDHVWKWVVPGGSTGNSNRDERILLRIVRALLNDIGLTMDEVNNVHENKGEQSIEVHANVARDPTKEPIIEGPKEDSEVSSIKDQTLRMLEGFQYKGNVSEGAPTPSTLPGELGGLCKMILEGESIALDGLPDVKLREALEDLLVKCGLDQFEMDDSDDEGADDDYDKKEDQNTTIGYGIPESPEEQERAKAKIQAVMDACQQAASASDSRTKRPVKGPMPMPAAYQPPIGNEEDESSDEEGPAPVGVAKRKGPSVPKELLKQQAEMRARQLKGAITGNEELMSTTGAAGQREEWMLVPGKFDFLSSIKAGNPMKSRTFKAQSKAGQQDASGSGRAMDPSVKAEMDAIMQAHSDARGPTLVEQHRMKKEQERQERASAGGGKKGDWKWSRDKDLDSGRRVDKNALNMILGGATDDLKKKFQGGF